jgi:hypothetical protein
MERMQRFIERFHLWLGKRILDEVRALDDPGRFTRSVLASSFMLVDYCLLAFLAIHTAPGPVP